MATILIAGATAIVHMAWVVVSLATTVPAKSPPVAIAAIIEARAIPAIHIETNRDVLDRVHAVERETRAQWRRRRTARHHRACRQDGCRRGKSEKKTMHFFKLLDEKAAPGSALWLQLPSAKFVHYRAS
jgi:hypothetical protein